MNYIITLLLAFLLVTPAFAQQRAGEVVSLLRSPEVRADGSEEWKRLLVGDDLNVGDRLRTGNGKIKLLLVDDTVLTLDQDSEMTVSKHLFRPKQQSRTSFFTLWSGRVKALVGAFVGESDVKIKTPTAVAGVRGTHFVVQIDPSKSTQAGGDGGGDGGNTRVFVLEGSVNLSNGTNSMDLGGGFTGSMNGFSIVDGKRGMTSGEKSGLKLSFNFRSSKKALNTGKNNSGDIDGDDGLDDAGDSGDLGWGPSDDGDGRSSRPSRDNFSGDSGTRPKNNTPPINQQSIEPGRSGGRNTLRIIVPKGKF